MSKKRKNKIFEDQVVDTVLEGVAESLTNDTKAVAPDQKIVLTTNVDGTKSFDLVPDISNESLVENVPDDPKAMDVLSDKLEQISQLTAELNRARQTIAELEDKIQKLQNDNNDLTIKLNEQSAKNAENIRIPLQVQLPSGMAADVIGQNQTKVVSKRVNYIHTGFSNNGYSSWN